MLRNPPKKSKRPLTGRIVRQKKRARETSWSRVWVVRVRLLPRRWLKPWHSPRDPLHLIQAHLFGVEKETALLCRWLRDDHDRPFSMFYCISC